MHRERLIYSMCTVFVMIAIFLFSSQTGKQTTSTSNILTKPIENNIKDNSDKTFETEKEETDYWKKINNLICNAVRKSAHVIIFSTLSIFVFLTLKSWNFKEADIIVITLIFCAFYAGTDELHQRFIDGRHSKVTDICIDECGVVIGIVIMWLADKIKNIRKKALRK